MSKTKEGRQKTVALRVKLFSVWLDKNLRLGSRYGNLIHFFVG